MRILALRIKILLESKPLKSRILVRRLAVAILWTYVALQTCNLCAQRCQIGAFFIPDVILCAMCKTLLVRKILTFLLFARELRMKPFFSSFLKLWTNLKACGHLENTILQDIWLVYVYIYIICIYIYIHVYTHIYSYLSQSNCPSVLSSRYPGNGKTRGLADLPATWKHGWSKQAFSRIPSNHPQIANSNHIYDNHVLIWWYSAKTMFTPTMFSRRRVLFFGAG